MDPKGTPQTVTLQGLHAFVLKEMRSGTHKLLSPFDLLWVFLAVVSAWSIPRGLGLRVEDR